MITITKKQVARGVRRLARQEPERANATSSMQTCTYRPSEQAKRDGVQPCIIGQLVADITGDEDIWVGVPNTSIGNAAFILKHAKGVAFTPKALDLALRIQTAVDADRTTPWSAIVPNFTTSAD